MTIQELEQRIAGRFVNRAGGSAFVMTRDPDEVDAWRQLGGHTNDASTATVYHVELHLAGVLDFVAEPHEDEDDPVLDARPRLVMEHFRERDGYSWPARAAAA